MKFLGVIMAMCFIFGCNGCTTAKNGLKKAQADTEAPGGIPNIGVSPNSIVNDLVKRGVTVAISMEDPKKPLKWCSGFVLVTGKVLTAAHCFPNDVSQKIFVDGKVASVGQVSTGAKEKDFMVLLVETAEFPKLELAEPTLDQEVYLVATQYNLASTFWRGRIIHISEDWISTDIQVVPGASGAPLVTTDGKLLGILTRGNAATTQVVRSKKLEEV